MFIYHILKPYVSSINLLTVDRQLPLFDISRHLSAIGYNYVDGRSLRLEKECVNTTCKRDMF